MTIKRALIVAGLILALAVAVSMASNSGFIDPDTGERVMGAANGLVLVLFANFMPKNLGPLSESRCAPGKGQNMRRFAAWTFVMAGLGHSIIWLTFSIPQAHIWATVVVASGLVLVVASVLFAAYRGSRSPTES